MSRTMAADSLLAGWWTGEVGERADVPASLRGFSQTSAGVQNRHAEG